MLFHSMLYTKNRYMYAQQHIKNCHYIATKTAPKLKKITISSTPIPTV